MTTIDVSDRGPAGARGARAGAASIVEPALRAAVDTLPASMRRIAGYHFGWWDEHGQPTRLGQRGQGDPARARTARAPRPSAVPPAAAVPAAAAVELVHNFSLLHDDVMDGDPTRRHRPTAWSVFGISAAILAGDALLALALDVLAGSGHPAATDGDADAQRRGAGPAGRPERGHGLRAARDVELAECCGWPSGRPAPCWGARARWARCSAAAPGAGRAAARLREHLGLAFQHVDDLLGIWGDPAVTGKPVYSDLRSRKKSLPVVAALTSDTPAGRELAALYHRHAPLSETDAAHAAELIDAAGGRAWSQTQADDLLAQAMQELQLSPPHTQPPQSWARSPGLATHRDH